MTRKDIAKMFKRFFITFACMLPIFILLGYLLNGRVSNFVMIVIFVVVGGAGYALEELISYNAYQKREQKKEENLKNKSK